MGTVDNTQLQTLVADVEAKRQALSDASDANAAAQTAAQSANAAATSTLAAQNKADDDLKASVAALVTYVQGLG